MGIEYKIKFDVAKNPHAQRVVSELNGTAQQSNNDYDIKIENDGIYFCDNCTNSPKIDKAFKRLVDMALSESNNVTITEL